MENNIYTVYACYLLKPGNEEFKISLLERQLLPSAGCTGSLLDASGHAHTCVPSGVGMQKWLQPPLFTEHAFFTPAKSTRWISWIT